MERSRKEIICCYISDAIMHITNNTARYAGGVLLERRLYDILHPKPVSTMTADEIIDQVFGKINKEVT